MMQLYYIVFCILLAYANAYVIRKGRRVYHGVNGLLHFCAWIVVFFISGKDWFFISMFPFLARLFFDVSLNLMRGLDLDYVPSEPKSIIDIVEQFFFKEDGFTPKGIYVIILGFLNGIYYATIW